MSLSYERVSCRFCGNCQLEKILDLGKSPLCDEYRRKSSEGFIFPLALNLCTKCHGVQTTEVVNADLIYKNYLYFTHTSPGLAQHFKDYAASVTEQFGLCRGLVIDVGSNDGCLLQQFIGYGFRGLGIEPSERARDYSIQERGVETIKGYLDRKVVDSILSSHGHAAIITFNNVFANIDNLEDVVELSSKLLDKDGIIVIETSYLFDMVNNLVFDFIYHEHLSYISLKPIQALFKKHGFRVFNVKHVKTKGGSTRYFIARESSRYLANDSVKTLSKYENDVGSLQDLFANFSMRINDAKDSLVKLLDELETKGRVLGYGASATSTTLLHAWRLGERFSGLIDDNPVKQGTVSPGYHLAVSSLLGCQLTSIDTVVILAWRFQSQILQNLKGFQGNIITPLPYPVLLQRHGSNEL